MTVTKLDLRSLLLAPICGLLLSPAFAAEPEEVPAAERERIAEMFESILPEHVKPSPIDGWYTIQKSSVVAYITTDGRYLLQGDLIDLEQQVNLTEANRTDARRDVMSAVTDDQVIMFSPAEVKYSVSIFTDVECT